MGKLKGILPIEGTVGSITFAKSDGGIIVRQKGGVSAKRVAKDPAFRRTRENNSEFGRAGKTASMLLGALRTVRAKADNRAISRLLKVLMAAQKADTVSLRGQRLVSQGNPALLEGFELNAAAPLAATFFAPYSVEVDRPAGTFKLKVTGAPGLDSVAPPAGATHYTIGAACILVNFDSLTHTTAGVTSGMLDMASAISLSPLQGTFTPGAADTILVVVSLTFYQEVNGSKYLLSNGAFNPAAVVQVIV